MALQQEYLEEYKALTNKEKAELVEEFETHKQEGIAVHQPTACACIQDVANVARNMQLLVRHDHKTCIPYPHSNAIYRCQD